jgi:protein phosphatase
VFLFAVLAVVGAAVWAVAWYARGAYYVGIDSEQVAIFRGRPGGLLWFDPTIVERKQQPTGAELLPAQRVELDAGHEVPSKAAADRYVNNLRQEVEARRAPPTTPVAAPTTTISRP